MKAPAVEAKEPAPPESKGTKRLRRNERDAVRAAGSYRLEVDEFVAGEAMGEGSVAAALDENVETGEPASRKRPGQ